MPQVYDPEQLEAEESAPVNSADPHSSQTAPGKMSYNTGRPKATSQRPSSPKIPDDEKSLYKPSLNSSSTAPGKVRFGNFLGTRRRKIVFGGIATGSATLVVVGFFVMLPLKILHIVNNLESHFYSTSKNALQGETDNLLEQYIVTRVLPSYKSCGTTIDRHCNARVFGSNPVSNLYSSWTNGRLENKLAENYHIEFQYRKSGWYMKTPSTSSEGISIGKDGEKLDSAFKKVGMGEMRQAIQKETKWYNVFTRFKVGSLLEEKYGIRRCIIFCKVTDPLANKAAEQKIAYKLYLTQRVITPRNQTLGIVLECLFSDCAADKTEPTNATPGENAALNGAAENPETDTALREGLQKLATQYGVTDIEALVSAYTEISEKGMQNYIIEKLFTSATAQATAKTAADKIPVVGWLDLAARLINAGNDSSRNLKKISYITNATAAVALFSMYRTYADEIKTGHVTATEVGSFTDSLSSTPSDAEVGGNASAEAAPLYHELIDGNSSSSTPTTASLFDNLLPAKTLAASTTQQSSNPATYKCNDGKPVPAGQPVCSEEVLGQGNHYADLVHEFLNMPGINAITTTAKLWKDSIGQLFDFVNGIVGSIVSPAFGAIASGLDATCGIPGAGYISPYCQARDVAKKYLPELMHSVIQWLIPNPYSSNMSGGRTFDMMAAGADVAGNDSAHTTLGGQKLSPQQTAVIINDQQSQDVQEFARQSLFARIFDTNSNYSLVSKTAIAMPSNLGGVSQSVANIFTNPLGHIGKSFSSLFSFSHTFAAATAQPDPFGVTQYGYPEGTIPTDPEAYWDQNCSDNASYAYRKTNDWNQAAADGPTDPNTQMPVNTTPNPCLLIMGAVGSAGATSPNGTSLLTADDLSGSSSSTDNTSSSSSTVPTVSSKVTGTFTPVCSPSWDIPSITSYGWPVKPFNQQHPVRGNLNDPRFAGSKDIETADSAAFHFGVDISAPDGTAVYSIEAGQVVGANVAGNHLQIQSADKILEYWHVNFSGLVSKGQKVAKDQIIGHIVAGEGHVHLAEAHRDPSGKIYYVSPLRPGALTPYSDNGAPVIKSLDVVGSSGVTSASTLSGKVSLSVNAYDIPPIAPPSPWNTALVTPAKVTWSVKDSSGNIVLPTKTATDFTQFNYGGDACSNITLDQVYATGTLQNGPGSGTIGNYNIYLIQNWDTSKMQNGQYTVTIAAKDIRDDISSKSFEVTIKN